MDAHAAVCLPRRPTTRQSGGALADAAAVLTPDPKQRSARAAHAATLRDKVGEADFDLPS